MLSFGHAVYSGLGAFLAIHAMNLAASGRFYIPLPLIPLVGGLSGLFFAALLGYVSTKKAGTTFAMITLGVGELVFAMSLMFPDFFGGEGGITTNRAYGQAVHGPDLRPADPGVLPDRGLLLRLHRRHVCLHPHAAGPHAQRRARQPRARRIHRLQPAARALPRLHHRRIFCRHRRRRWRRSTPKSSRPKWSAACARAACCCSPFWAARPSSSGRSLALSCWCWRWFGCRSCRWPGCCMSG